MRGCPKCEGSTRVLETRDTGAGTRRRRECRRCGHRFTTYEVLPTTLLSVAKVKHDPQQGVDAEDIADEVVTQIEARLDEIPQETVDALLLEAEYQRERGEIGSGAVGELEAGEE